MLASSVDIVADMLLVQLGGELVDDHADVFLALGALLPHQVHQVLVPGGVDIPQGQVLQLLLDGVHAQAVGQRRINIEGFPGDGRLAGFPLELQRSHIMQTVCQLDEHHADILGHGQDHLAQ